MRNKVIIYGAGEVGELTANKFKKNAYEVIVFLDKNKKGCVCDVQIYSVDEYVKSLTEFEDIPVVICLSNGVLHKKVADELYESGFQYIYFLPIGYSLPISEKIKITHLFNYALDGNIVELIPYQKYKNPWWIENEKRIDNYVYTWLGQEVLFSEDISTWKGDLTKIHCINDGVDVNLNVYKWYHELYQYMDGETEDAQSYLDIFSCEKDSVAARERIIERESLYRDFERALNRDIEYFVESSPEVVWNSKGYFNLVGGHHRTIFLQHKGYVYYPVKMSSENYEHWKNEFLASELINYLEVHHVESLYVPVSNPYFMDFLSVRETKAKGVLYKILNYIGPIRLEGKKIIDCSQYEGYFARITKRMCASEVIHYSFEWQQKEIAEKIAGVLHVQNINFEMLSCLDIEIIRTADMIFAMQNIDKLLDGNLFDGYKGILFIEMSVDKRQQFLDKIKEKTHLINYQYLHREVVNGELLEVGVFS